MYCINLKSPLYLYLYYILLYVCLVIVIVYLINMKVLYLIFEVTFRKRDVLRDRNLPIHRNPVCYPRQKNVIYMYFEYFPGLQCIMKPPLYFYLLYTFTSIVFCCMPSIEGYNVNYKYETSSIFLPLLYSVVRLVSEITVCIRRK